MKALVISGGGSKGAFAGGLAEYLINIKNRNYEIFVGTSTGSLLVPQLSIGHIENIKNAYCNVSQKDIYNVSPFRLNEKHQNGSAKINHLNIIKMFLKGKKTFGDHQNLLKTLRRTISPEEFELIRSNHKKVIVTVANLSLNILEFKYANDYDYEEFTEWMWISTSFVPFMGIVERNGYEYADGGFGSQIPIDEAINAGATEVDVIVLTPRYSFQPKKKTKNAFDVLLSAMDFMHNRIGRDDLYIGHLHSVYDKNVKINFYFTPRLLTQESFIFRPSEMKAWWQEGYEYGGTLDIEGKL